MPAKRIVMLGHKRVPSRDGGVEIVVGELSTRMARLGYDVTCLNRNVYLNEDEIDNQTKSLSIYKGVKLLNVKTIDINGISAVSSSFFGSFEATKKKYDVVHYHAEGPAFMCWLPKLFKKKIIVTIHGLDYKRIKWGKFSSWFIKQGEKNAVKYADHIIVLSQSDQKYFIEQYNRKTVLIPNAVDKPTIIKANVISKKYKLKKDDYILFLGRIVPEKGVDDLIEAYNRINTNKKLVIAGGQSGTAEYYEKIKSKAINNNNVIFTGFVQGEELEELYSNAYIYCLPSYLEGMPISLLEAMSYGNCCLTSDLDICKDVMNDNGLFYKLGDKQDLYDKLEQLCNDKDIVKHYKSISREYICNKYNWDDVVNRTIELYNN